MLNSTITQIGLVTVAVISLTGSVVSLWSSRRNRKAEAGRTEREAERIGDKTWIERLDALARDFDRLQQLSDERFAKLVEIEMLITEHVDWDWQVIRLLREHGIPVSDPPSLVYVRRKLQEAKDKEREQQHVNHVSEDEQS